MHPEEVKNMIEESGGKVDSMTVLPDGHGFATASFPLPKDHWLYRDDGYEDFPQACNLHIADPVERDVVGTKIRDAVRFAVRCATMKGTENDFDPDCLVQNVLRALLGVGNAKLFVEPNDKSNS